MGFDFDRLMRAFEQIQEEYESPLGGPTRPLPSTERFLSAMAEVNKLFETLGSAFTFVKRDIEKKLAVITRHQAEDRLHYAHLNDALSFETRMRLLTARTDDGLPSLARTLLRLMWALKFADQLLDGLGQAFDPHSPLLPNNRTLKWAVSRAYDAALAEHHSWTVRRSVKAACLLLPGKEVFMERVGVDLDCREDYMERLALSMSPLVKRLYAFYDKHELLQLP